MTEEATRQAQKVGQTITQKGEELSKTQTFKTISETAKAVKEEIDHSTFGGAGARVYRAPSVLRKRVERDPEAEKRIIKVGLFIGTEYVDYVVFFFVFFSQSPYRYYLKGSYYIWLSLVCLLDPLVTQKFYSYLCISFNKVATK